jgi:hypothetical protein
LETDELAEGLKERVPTEEDPREPPHEPLRPPVAGVEEEGAESCWSLVVGERERGLRRGQQFRGLNTPEPTPSRTLSSWDILSGKNNTLKIFLEILKVNIYIYMTWSPHNQYTNLTMIRAT